MYLKNVADILGFLYYPDDDGIGGIATDESVIEGNEDNTEDSDSDEEDSEDDDSGDDDSGEESEEGDEDTESEEDSDNDKDSDDDDKGDEEDDVNLASFSDIKEKYPKIFKEFPE